jgi:hypothetical protein
MDVMNPNCDGGRCKATGGQVRVLPLGRPYGRSGGGNAILCRDCFEYEIAWRKQRNEQLAPHAQYDLPSWSSLEVYES